MKFILNLILILFMSPAFANPKVGCHRILPKAAGHTSFGPDAVYRLSVVEKEFRITPYDLKNEASDFSADVMEQNGVMVINRTGDGATQIDNLQEMAQHFQTNNEVEKVIFTDEITEKGPRSYLQRFKTFIRSRTSSLTEFISNFFSRDHYLGQNISIGIDGKPGNDLTFEVSDFIGAGVFGVVHKIKIIKMSEAGKQHFYKLLNEGAFREDLVVKFPHNVPLLKILPKDDIFVTTLIKENDDIEMLQNIITKFHQDAADILANGANDKPFLIKNFLPAASLQSLSKTQSKLTEEQAQALHRDIYKMAEAVKKQLKADLDIKAENVAWDSTNKRFVMYEMSLKQSKSSFLVDGFNGYLDYFNGRLEYYATKRQPSSSSENIVVLCKDNKIPIPHEFKGKFKSAMFEGDFDFENQVLSLNHAELQGCFKISQVTYADGLAQMHFVIKNKKNAKQEVEFGLLKNLKNANEPVWGAFAIKSNGEAQATSYIHEMTSY